DERIRGVTAVIDDVVERWRNIGFAPVLPKFGTAVARLARRPLPGAHPPQRRARPQASFRFRGWWAKLVERETGDPGLLVPQPQGGRPWHGKSTLSRGSSRHSSSAPD